MLGSGWRSSAINIRIHRNSATSTPITGTVPAIRPPSASLFGRHAENLNSPPSPPVFHDFSHPYDKNFVSPFLKQAEEIFQAAQQGGREDLELAILVGRDGAIHMLPAEGWELESLRLDRGARAAYRVSRAGTGVRLEARSAGESCMLQARLPVASPAHPWRSALAEYPRYLTLQ